MRKEIIKEAKTVEEALALAAKGLGVDASAITTYEVITEAKKGFLGIGATDAKVRVIFEEPGDAASIALDFVNGVIREMELNAEAHIHSNANGEARIEIAGENAGILIGHHGDTLDALQYLANLAANKREEHDDNYTKISVDVENYRAKREETLRGVARRMANKVQKYKKSMTLEPMNPYERRIIHAEIQKIEGVSTNSVGSEHSRRIVVFLVDENGEALTPKDGRNERRAKGDKKGAKGERKEGKENKEGGENGERKAKSKGGRNDRRRSEKPQTAAPVTAPDSEGESTEKDESVSTKKPYYIRPRHASTRIPADLERTRQKPVKKESVESYFFDLENGGGFTREKEEPSDIAKACGIYDGDPEEQN